MQIGHYLSDHKILQFAELIVILFDQNSMLTISFVSKKIVRMILYINGTVRNFLTLKESR